MSTPENSNPGADNAEGQSHASPPPPQGFPRHAPPPPPQHGAQWPVQGQPPYRMTRRRTGLWRTLGLMLFVGVIGFNILLFIAMFGGAGFLAGGQANPHGVVEYGREGGEGGKIAVIKVDGVILEGAGGGLFSPGVDPVAMMQDGLRSAAADKSVDAVIIEINSPGGGVTASDHIHHAILDFKEDTGKPVVVYMKDLAASGGYYISAPADHIVANRTSLTGSIGVIIQNFNLHGTLTEVVKGRDATVKSGDNKNMGSMFADPESEEYKEGRRLLQELADEIHVQFKEVVRTGRGEKLAEDWETYADGRILSASQALKVGFIDKIGYFDDAKAKAEELAQISNAAVVEYGRDTSLGALLGLSAADTKPEAMAAAVGEEWKQEVQEHLRLYPHRPMAIWIP